MATLLPIAAQAAPLTIDFTAAVGTSNNTDTANAFGEGYNANLTGQAISGTVTIDPTTLVQICGSGGACWADFGGGTITVGFTLNGITISITSTGTLGYFGNRSGGSVMITDPPDGGYNSFEIGATTPDGMVQESVGALFNNATLFSAYGNGDPVTAISSLAAISYGAGLVWGGITYLSPVEHLDATITSIDVLSPSPSTTVSDISEPATLALLGVSLLGLARARRGAVR